MKKKNWEEKKVLGDQFIRATDSVGANIAEGYGRYHYLDKIKFMYNARGSLFEALHHWIDLIEKRLDSDKGVCSEYQKTGILLRAKLQNFISATYRSKHS